MHLNEHRYVLGQLERYDRAFKALTRASELEPRNPWPWEYRSELLSELSRYDEALEAAQRGLAIKSDSEDFARRLNQEAAKTIRYGGAYFQVIAEKFISAGPRPHIYSFQRLPAGP